MEDRKRRAVRDRLHLVAPRIHSSGPTADAADCSSHLPRRPPPPERRPSPAGSLRSGDMRETSCPVDGAVTASRLVRRLQRGTVPPAAQLGTHRRFSLDRARMPGRVRRDLPSGPPSAAGQPSGHRVITCGNFTDARSAARRARPSPPVRLRAGPGEGRVPERRHLGARRHEHLGDPGLPGEFEVVLADGGRRAE
jgi:hypothetical protein